MLPSTSRPLRRPPPSASVRPRLVRSILATFFGFATAALLAAGEATPPPTVRVVDGLVQPRRPVAEAIVDAMQFLKKADGAYGPGRIDGDLAGYFSSAFVQADGSRAPRPLLYPARQHAYFIRTFLRYYAYTGESEWLRRARDLADWNIAHSTPAGAAYPHLPYSTFQNGKPTGNQDKNSIEPDKAAFLGAGYLGVYEATADPRYLDAARQIADALVPRQRDDGSWPFRTVPEDGSVYEDVGGAPVFFAEFFERLLRHDDQAAYRRARDGAVRCVITRNVEQGKWGTYHEDIRPKGSDHLSAEPMSFTADYLFQHARERPEFIEMGRRVLRQMEAKLVHTTGHAATPAPAVAEQATFAHIMPGHTARYCLALSDLFLATGDEAVKGRALSGLNAVTYMQAETGLFRTFFYDVRRQSNQDAGRPNWYSQHLYTVCHLLECMAAFPELAPAGQDHILGASTALREVHYGPGLVQYASLTPGRIVMKLSFVPQRVRLAGQPLRAHEASAVGDGWFYDPKTQVLTIRHPAGTVHVSR